MDGLPIDRLDGEVSEQYTIARPQDGPMAQQRELPVGASALLKGGGAGPAFRGGADSPHGFLDVFERIGVAEAQKAFALLAEASSVEAGDAGVVQQIICEILRRHSRTLDIRERVESSGRKRAAEAGNPVQSLANRIAA